MAKPAETDAESEVNFELMARKELAQLQRQYRVMETDRQIFIQGKGRNMSRQGRMLDYLKHEKSDLLIDIQNALSVSNLRKDKQSEQIVTSMLEAYFRCVEEIQSQIEEIVELETQVDKITKRVISQKLKTQAIFGRSMTIGQAGKRLRVLENRKYHATTQFDTKVTENSLLRADINLSLMERGRFHERYRRLKRQIAAAKHKMLIVVDNALTTYEGREEAVMKIHMLRERNDRESQQHVLEIKEYQRVFHHDQKLRVFMKVKNKQRDVVEKSEDRSQRLTLDREKQLDELIRQYKKSFAQLLSLGQTKNVETLLHQYLSQEQVNLSSFKFITDLNNETCVLEEGIRKLKIEIEKAVSRAKNNRKNQATTLKRLSRINDKNKTELLDRVNAWQSTQEHMNKIIHAVDVMFDHAGCANAPVIQLLGNRSGILSRNLTLCLKVLEHRIGELQYQRNLLEVRKAIIVDKTSLPIKQGYWQPGKKPPPSGGPFKPKVILTTISTDVEEGDEESERQMSMRPMTYKEIRDFYKSKLQEQNPVEMETNELEFSSPLDSLSNVITKAKFAPPIQAQIPTPKSTPPVDTKGSINSDNGSLKSSQEVTDADSPEPQATRKSLTTSEYEDEGQVDTVLSDIEEEYEDEGQVDTVLSDIEEEAEEVTEEETDLEFIPIQPAEEE